MIVLWFVWRNPSTHPQNSSKAKLAWKTQTFFEREVTGRTLPSEIQVIADWALRLRLWGTKQGIGSDASCQLHICFGDKMGKCNSESFLFLSPSRLAGSTCFHDKTASLHSVRQKTTQQITQCDSTFGCTCQSLVIFAVPQQSRSNFHQLPISTTRLYYQNCLLQGVHCHHGRVLQRGVCVTPRGSLGPRSWAGYTWLR